MITCRNAWSILDVVPRVSGENTVAAAAGGEAWCSVVVAAAASSCRNALSMEPGEKTEKASRSRSDGVRRRWRFAAGELVCSYI